jgi:two-component system response regulator FixJ
MCDTAVFLVDDDDAVRDSLTLLLEAHGLRVRGFTSGLELLDQGGISPNACLVLDVHMPVMSGLDVLEKLAADGTAPPTVLITGRADSETRRRAVAAGASGLIEKPFDATELMSAIKRAVGSACP